MRKYYGVAGTRGYGVYTNWNQAKSAEGIHHSIR